tara:strand:- start:1242 stop:1412 length:171 start_codon:yes stop_codon:yes gene_type:complete
MLKTAGLGLGGMLSAAAQAVTEVVNVVWMNVDGGGCTGEFKASGLGSAIGKADELA